MPRLVLVVDDDPVQRRLVEAALAKAGHEPVCAEGGEAALAAMEGPRGGDIAVVVLDLMMPDVDGLEVLARMRARGIAVPVIVQTARGSIDTAVQAMRAGAFDFVVKPAAPERLQAAVANAMKVEAHEDAARRAGKGEASRLAFGDLVTGSEAMERVIRLARKAAASDIPILIEGESGVGKEVIARAIQGLGPRAGKPFVTVNCGAIPENLVESILFGHEKGSFTGATERHVGKFVEANGGTLFLDEIGDLPLDVQVKLLRAVQEGEVDPVGARDTVKVDIRLISATHRDLLQRVRDGLFREDLFYRLNVFPIEMPALRERIEDLPLLLNELITRLETEKRGSIRFSTSAIMSLCRHDWPGNVRELANLVERMAIMHPYGVIGVMELPKKFRHVDDDDEQYATSLHDEMEERAAISAPMVVPEAQAMLPIEGLDLKEYLGNLEQGLIHQALEDAGGVVARAAERLRIRRTTLVEKMRKYGMNRRDDDMGD